MEKIGAAYRLPRRMFSLFSQVTWWSWRADVEYRGFKHREDILANIIIRIVRKISSVARNSVPWMAPPFSGRKQPLQRRRSAEYRTRYS